MKILTLIKKDRERASACVPTRLQRRPFSFECFPSHHFFMVDIFVLYLFLFNVPIRISLFLALLLLD